MFDESQNIRIGKRTTFFGPRGTADWATYYVPPGCVGLLFLIAAGGGGGGNGAAGTAGTARGGGGGGASSGLVRLMLPTFVLPNTLFIQPGFGGASSTIGGTTTVGTRPSTTPSTTNLYSLPGGGAGGNGTSAAGQNGLAGNIGTAGLFFDMGSCIAIAGRAGENGGSATTAGTGHTPLAVISGAAGGGGVTTVGQLGGDIFTNGVTPAIPGGAIGASGTNGVDFLKPFISTGGSGGGSSNAGAGGVGGNGGRGSGGGGGGAGVTGSPGLGGRGGDGFVLITELFGN